MYDTITLFVNAEDVPGTDFMAELPLKLSNISEVHAPYAGAIKVRGALSNFHATVSHSGLLLTGSLCKYFFGENQHTLTLENTREAFGKLFAELGLPIEQAKVYRIDIAANYEVDKVPCSYFSYMGDAKYYTRSLLSTSLYYKNNGRQLVMYDKLLEQEHKKTPIIPEYVGKKILRYEYRLRKRLAERMGRTEVRPLDLCDPVFYRSLLEKYQQEYFNVEKYSLVDFAPDVMTDTKSFIGQLALLGIQNIGGQLAVNDIIIRANKQGIFDNSMQYKRVRDKVKEICNMPLLTCKSPHIDELTAKITARVAAEITSLPS